MRSRTASVLLFAALNASSVACRPVTDLGMRCVLVRRDPTDTDGSDGYRSVPIKEADIQGEANKDYISFGATECLELVCVRSLDMPLSGAPGADAEGYCSDECVEGRPCLAADPADDEDPARKLTCRALILSEETLSNLCRVEPEKCQQYFGTTPSPFFCARGTPPEG